VNRSVNEIDQHRDKLQNQHVVEPEETTYQRVLSSRWRPVKSVPANDKKFWGVLQWLCSKWAAEIRDPAKHTGIRIRGPDALTNFVTPPPKEEKPEVNVASVSGYDSGEESQSQSHSHSHSLSSPTSVLQYRTHSNEEEAQLRKSEKQQKPVEEPMVDKGVFRECQAETILGDYLPLDLQCFNEVFNFSGPDAPILADIFSGPDMVFDEPIPGDIFKEDIGLLFNDNTFEGFGSSSSSMMNQGEDYFQDILFGSDPLVVL